MRIDTMHAATLAALLVTSAAACGDDDPGAAGGGGAASSTTTTASSSETGGGAGGPGGGGDGAGGDGAGGDDTGAGGDAATSTGTGAGSGGGGGGVAGCRDFPADPPECDYEPPIVVDDATPDEDGVVVIRDRCFLQPETISLSDDGNVTEPAIRIQTQRPVLIENVITVSAASHITADGFADVTIRRSSGYGLEPVVDDVPRGTYLTMEGFNRVTVERSFLAHTRGLQLWAFEGDDAGERTIRIVGNVARNIDGRCRNTGGGCGNTGDYQFANFVSFNGVRGKDIEIAWNDVENQPDESSVEDNLGLYRAAGTPDGPMRVHHNAIRGGWEYPVSSNFTGSCLTTDGDPETVDEVGYIEATDNLCIGVPMNIAGGHDVHYRDNVYASSGLLPDGTPMTQCFWCIGGIYDFYEGGNLVNDSIEDYLYGMPEAVDAVWVAENGNPMTVEKMPEPVTLETEAALVQAWCDDAAAAGVVLGP